MCLRAKVAERQLQPEVLLLEVRDHRLQFIPVQLHQQPGRDRDVGGGRVAHVGGERRPDRVRADRRDENRSVNLVFLVEEGSRFYIERIAVSATYLQSLIKDLLQFSRIGRSQTETEEVSLQDALNAGAEHFAEALDYFPAVENFLTTAERYLESLTARPVVGDAEVVQEPTEQPYGLRDCAFRDPAGNLLRIQELR